MRHTRRRRLGPRRRHGIRTCLRQGRRNLGGCRRWLRNGDIPGSTNARCSRRYNLSGLGLWLGSTLRLQRFGGLCSARWLSALGRFPYRLSSSLFSGRKLGRSGLGCGCIFLLFLLATEKTEHVVRPV
jgi:hypothetical protein